MTSHSYTNHVLFLSIIHNNCNNKTNDNFCIINHYLRIASFFASFWLLLCVITVPKKQNYFCGLLHKTIEKNFLAKMVSVSTYSRMKTIQSKSFVGHSRLLCSIFHVQKMHWWWSTLSAMWHQERANIVAARSTKQANILRIWV